jgi:glycosyltransferase involved in cell wall biosynthesis
MRVLYVAEAFGGGVFELVRTVAERASERGVTTAIAYGVRPETPPHLSEEIDSGVELIPMPWTDRTPLAQLSGARRLRQLVDSWQPDVVHLYSALAGVWGAISVPRSVPTVFTPQAYAFTRQPERPPIRQLVRSVEAFASRRATVVGACSETEAMLAQGLGAQHVALVENGIPELDVDPNGNHANARPPLVVALGRTAPQRQPEACARILSELRDVAEVAWIGGAAGNGAGEDGTAALRRAGIGFSGWLRREEALRRLAQATAYLHWTAWDGLPLSMLEAMALDVAVVASDIGPNREVIGPEAVRTSEEEAIDALRRIVTDPAERDAALKRQRLRRRRYGATRMVDNWIELYEWICDGAPNEHEVATEGAGRQPEMSTNGNGSFPTKARAATAGASQPIRFPAEPRRRSTG